jgi:hypothetical protein
MKKQKIQTMYNIDDLNYLKNLFYKFEKLEDVNSEKLNKSLNLFYGLTSKNNEDWKEEFKDSIKRKAEKSKEGKQKFINVSPNDFKEIETKEIIKQAFLKKNSIKQQLKSLYANKSTFKSTIIYEAPPYLLSIMEKDGSLNNEFVAEFILDDKCSSPYSNAIRGCFNNKETQILDILTKNDCGFFDVIPIPLPINSNLRNQWATEEKFVFDGKKIFVHFFEWAIENYIKEAEISKDEKHKIAIGIPLNNAITLYEHFAPTKIVKFGKHKNHKITFNDPHTIDLKNKKSGLWIHPFKNCVISTSNTPNAELMKLAFDK